MDDEIRKEALGEVLMDELKAIREYVQEIPGIKQDVVIIKDDMAEVKTDVKAIKAVIRDHETDIKYLKQKVA